MKDIKNPQTHKHLPLLVRIWGISLIIFGIMGVILPVLPGWPFIFLGLFVLGGSALVDEKILKYLPRKWREYILKRLQKYDKNGAK